MARQRPGQLLAIGMIGLGLGVLGGCVGVFSFASAVASGPMESLQRAQLESQYGHDPAQLARQVELQDSLRAETERWLPLNLGHQLLNLLASLALLIASILLFRWHPKAPGLFTGAAFASLAVDLIGVTVAIVVQLAMQDVMRTFLVDSAAADPNLPAGMDQMMGAVAEASVGASVCMGLAFFGVKAAYYLWGIFYLRKDEARALFTATSPAAPTTT